MAHILIVDDEKTICAIIAKMLTYLGHAVCYTESGKDALDLLENQKVDLVLSDIQMPEMDGYTLLREVKLHHPEIHFVAMSGHVEEDHKDNVLFDGFLKKPFILKDLVQVMDKTLAKQSTW